MCWVQRTSPPSIWYTLTNVLMAGIYLRGLQNADMGSDIYEAWITPYIRQ